MPKSANKRTRAVGTRKNEGVRAYRYADRVVPIIDALKRHGGSATAAELFDWLHNNNQYGKMFKEKRRINATWRQLVRHMDNQPYVFDGSQFRLRKMQRNGAGKRQKIGRKLTRGLGINPDVDDIVKALEERSTGRSSRQGFNVPVAARRAIEDLAMKRATGHFAQQGWTVEDVHDREPYDLRCLKRNQELRVEVKGTSGAGSEIILTPNEVAHARKRFPNVALYVLADIVWKRTGGRYRAKGGREFINNPWRIDDGTLKPLSYTYKLPQI